MAAYPKDFPLAESIELVSIIRQKQVKAKLPVFGRDLWTLQGFAMRSTLGDPDEPTTTPVPPPTESGGGFSIFSVKPDEFDGIVALEKLNTNYSAGDIQKEFVIPWQLILKWALEELVTLVATAA